MCSIAHLLLTCFCYYTEETELFSVSFHFSHERLSMRFSASMPGRCFRISSNRASAFRLSRPSNVSDDVYTTNKQNGKKGTAKTVVFEKAVNGTYYVVEAAPDTAKKTNFIVSTYMSKKAQKKQPPYPSLAKKARALRPNTQQEWLLMTMYHR